jgi:hypothetical protein
MEANSDPDITPSSIGWDVRFSTVLIFGGPIISKQDWSVKVISAADMNHSRSRSKLISNQASLFCVPCLIAENDGPFPEDSEPFWARRQPRLRVTTRLYR